LPRHPGVSAFKDMHVTTEDLIDPSEHARQVAEAEQRAIEDTRRAVGRVVPVGTTKPRRYVRVKTLGKVLRVVHDVNQEKFEALQRRLEALEAALQAERERCRELPDFRQEQPLGQWSQANASWRQ
jgi:hypothetical protein